MAANGSETAGQGMTSDATEAVGEQACASNRSGEVVLPASVRPGRYAAIDIGTVTCRMLVADVDASGNLSELTCEYAITNLGEGVDATGRLKPEAISRVVETVKSFLAVRDSYLTPTCPRIETVAMATSASRDAENAADFQAALREIGVELTVIPGQREAELSFSGASCDFAGEDLMVIDIGGGSTEVVVGAAQGAPRWAHSFDIGCRRVTERFLAGDPPTEAELADAREWVAAEMRGLFAEAKEVAGGEFRLVAVAGTATTIVTVRDGITEYDSKLVHKQQVTRAELDGQYDELKAMTTAVRQQVPGLDPGRAPVIVAGLLIMQAVMDLAGVRAFTVSETDILHGIILDAAGE
jgi:exopolyphosphatase / guanosine-5'-triphosphate,3'-diphosphate pyrophosphatase